MTTTPHDPDGAPRDEDPRDDGALRDDTAGGSGRGGSARDEAPRGTAAGTRRVGRSDPEGLDDDGPDAAAGGERAADDAAGVELELEVGAIAHGGHCVARHDGRVVFVRHALPGELVVAVVTEGAPGDSFWRADAVEVLRASPDRVEPAWPEAASRRGRPAVGGAELMHVALPAQRAWKAAVVAEQLQRLAHLEREVVVEPAPGDDERDGLGWRTRIALVADEQGRAGMRGHRSHRVHPLTSMPLASPAIQELDLFSRSWPAGARIEVVAPAAGGEPLVVVDGAPWRAGRVDKRSNARTGVREEVVHDGARYDYRVNGLGFWQVHREAPAVLVAAVLDALGGPEELVGRAVIDLYAGAGLFTLPLADAVGLSGSVISVEGDERAVKDARRTLHARPQVELHHGDVARVLQRAATVRGEGLGQPDAVVLDPPRTGARAAVVEGIAALRPPSVVYVACDPAALARDVASFADHGYELASLRALDLFPHTHHVECVAHLVRG